MDMRIELSLCVITKNDEEYVGECLRQFKDIAEEMIVADIGSGDGTLDIARQEGAAVYELEWKGDFSGVKNFCMDHANGRWVLFLQPNETISPEQRDKIKELLQNPNAEAFLIFVDYNSAGYGVASPVQSLRLIRNHEGNRFSYRSFETVPDEVLTGVVNSGLQIKQRFDAMESWELNERIRLLEKEIAEEPQDCYLQYLAGIVLLNRQRFEESIALFQSARLSVNFGYLYAPHLYKVLSWAYLYLERYAKAMEVLDEGILNFPFYNDLLILRGELYKQLNRPEDAAKDMFECLRMRERPNISPFIPEIDNAYIFASLGEIYERSFFDYTRALAYFVKAYELDSTDAEILVKAAGLIRLVESDEAADKLLSAAIKQGDPKQLQTLLDRLMKHHMVERVLLCTGDIAPVLGAEGAKKIELCCRLMTGDTEYIEGGNECDMLPWRIEGCWLRGDLQKAEELLKRLEDTVGGTAQNLYRYMQRVFEGGETGQITLTQEEYDEARRVHDDMLWKGDKKKALSLLPVLLERQDDDSCIDLAIPWTRKGNFAAIKKIFSNVGGPEKKREFVYIISRELLRHGHADTAFRLKKLGGIELPEELELLLWAGRLIKKLTAWVKGLAKNHEGIVTHEGTDKLDVDNNLLEFCRDLCARDSGGAGMKTEMTADKAHERIGDSYMKKNKKTEALFAYARALRTQPLNFSAQKKAIRLLDESPRLETVFDKDAAGGGGAWFAEKDEWIRFIRGIGHFISGRFQKALPCFEGPAGNKKTESLFDAYAAGCLWLDGKEPNKAVRITAGSAEMILHICLNYILLCLRKGYRRYADLLMLQEKRITELIKTYGI